MDILHGHVFYGFAPTISVVLDQHDLCHGQSDPIDVSPLFIHFPIGDVFDIQEETVFNLFSVYLIFLLLLFWRRFHDKWDRLLRRTKGDRLRPGANFLEFPFYSRFPLCVCPVLSYVQNDLWVDQGPYQVCIFRVADRLRACHHNQWDPAVLVQSVRRDLARPPINPDMDRFNGVCDL